jgi:hypothetical protein
MLAIHKAGLSVCALLGLTLVAAAQDTKDKDAKDAKDTEGWTSLFDGKSLGNWQRTKFTGGGKVRVEEKFKGDEPAIVVEAGSSLSGFNWIVEDKKEKTPGDKEKTAADAVEKKLDLPKTNYELSLEAMKIEGNDFMCGLTFPVDKSHASLILGGWGGSLVGISSIDNRDASENDTTKYMDFPKDQWRKIKVRVTPAKLEAWLDEKQIVDQEIKGKKISLRPGEIDLSVPLGVSTFQTSSAFRNIKLRKIEPAKP